MKNKEPTFLMILHAESLSSNPKIERDQLTSLNGEMWSSIFVKGINSVDQIDIESCDRSITLKYGWKKFVRKNTLQEHDVVLFWREYHNMFNVTIYDKTGHIIREKRGLNQEKNGTPAGLANGCFSNNFEEGGPSKKTGKRKTLCGRDSHFKKGRIQEEIVEIATDDNSRDETDDASVNKEADVGEESNNVDSSHSMKVTSTTRAMLRAEEFNSDNPSFMKAMKNGTRSNKYYIMVPTKFGKKYLPRKFTKIKLRVAESEGREENKNVWRVHCTYSNCMAAWHFCSGWNEFKFHNNLREGDVCVFEMTTNREKTNGEKEIELTVHIFRAVE